MNKIAKTLVGAGVMLPLTSCMTVDAIQQLPSSWWLGLATVINAIVEDVWNLARFAL